MTTIQVQYFEQLDGIWKNILRNVKLQLTYNPAEISDTNELFETLAAEVPKEKFSNIQILSFQIL